MSVGIYVASYNTLELTRGCLESVLARTPEQVELTVGDSGSQDGSVEWLRAQAERGRIRLQVEAEQRLHSWWLDRWLAESGHDFAVFLDSDVVVRRASWLGALLRTAERHDAAIVAAEMCAETPNFVEPVAHRTVRLARRPGPWLMLLRPERIRALGLSYGFAKKETTEVPEGLVAYDVGARVYEAACAAGLIVRKMPSWYRLSYRHLHGGSWRR